MTTRWLFVAPLMLLAGCSRSHTPYPEPQAGQPSGAANLAANPAPNGAPLAPNGTPASVPTNPEAYIAPVPETLDIDTFMLTNATHSDFAILSLNSNSRFYHLIPIHDFIT